MSTEAKPPRDEEVENLLPWFATGRLSPAETERVRRALTDDADLAARLALAREEQEETRAVAEAMPVPSSRARDAVLDRIQALERGRGPAVAATGGLVGRILAWVADLSPRHVAWAGGAAALLIVVQAGLLVGTWVSHAGGQGVYGTASGGGGPSGGTGTFALVSFAPSASVDRITAFLAERGMVIVDGPRGSGLYRVRIAPVAAAAEDRDRILADLRARPDLIGFAAAAQ